MLPKHNSESQSHTHSCHKDWTTSHSLPLYTSACHYRPYFTQPNQGFFWTRREIALGGSLSPPLHFCLTKEMLPIYMYSISPCIKYFTKGPLVCTSNNVRSISALFASQVHQVHNRTLSNDHEYTWPFSWLWASCGLFSVVCSVPVVTSFVHAPHHTPLTLHAVSVRS